MNKKDWDKASENYFQTVDVSPFSKRVENPIIKKIEKIKKNKRVIDLGCGIGNLIPYIKDFKEVTAIDFSQGMINKAKEKYNKLENVTFEVGDLRELKKYYNKFEIAFCINSVILPSIKDINTSFKEISKVLISNGMLIGIFPSMDSEILRATLTINNELKNNNEKQAIINTHKELDSQDYDYLLGLYNHEGNKQKHFYKEELIYYLEKYGFKDISFDKVLYPWDTWEVKNSLKTEQKLWDWIVFAHKK